MTTSTINLLQQSKQNPPDLALVDVSLKDGDGIELVKELRGLIPDLPALVLSMHDEQIYAERYACRPEPCGFIMKQEPPEYIAFHGDSSGAERRLSMSVIACADSSYYATRCRGQAGSR